MQNGFEESVMMGKPQSNTCSKTLNEKEDCKQGLSAKGGADT